MILLPPSFFLWLFMCIFFFLFFVGGKRHPCSWPFVFSFVLHLPQDPRRIFFSLFYLGHFHLGPTCIISFLNMYNVQCFLGTVAKFLLIFFFLIPSLLLAHVGNWAKKTYLKRPKNENKKSFNLCMPAVRTFFLFYSRPDILGSDKK